MKYYLQSWWQPSGRQEELWLPQVEPGSQTPEGRFSLLLASDLVLHGLFQNNVLSVNALCLCSAVNGVLPWPEKMRGWTATVAFSCFHPFGGGEKLLLKSQRDWWLCRDTSGLTQRARGRRRACMTVCWSLHREMTTVWSWGSKDSLKPPDKSSSWGMHQNWRGEWVNCMISEQLDEVSGVLALWKLCQVMVM